MPLFARRDIQDRIYALGDCLPADQIAAIVERLNNHQRDRMAALWEIVMLQAFSTLGTLTSEAELEDGKRPDILLRPIDPALPVICADITAVSDAGIETENPVRDFLHRVFATARKVGLNRGLHVRVNDQRIPVRGGEKTKLLLPERCDWDAFIKSEVEPFLLQAVRDGPVLPPLVVEAEGVSLSIDDYGGANHSAHHPSYRRTSSILANPLMNQLKRKARTQLRKVPSTYFKGIIACDAFADSLRGRTRDLKTYSRFDVASAFMAENTSIDFVFFVSVITRHAPLTAAASHALDVQIVTRPGLEDHPAIALMARLPDVLPRPIRSLSIASGMAKQSGLGTRGYGALTMSEGTIKISVRLLMDILAGRTSFAELDANYPSSRQNPFRSPAVLERALASIEIVPGPPEDDDNYVEFNFGPPDAVNGPYLAKRPTTTD